MPSRPRRLAARVGELVRAIRDGDDDLVERAVLDLSQSRRIFAPLAFLVGAFAMLFEGVRLLFSNWRLTLVEILPAMWIWFAMLDLKLHVVKGRTFSGVRGSYLVPVIAGIAILTAASFFLNAVFAFAIARPGAPEIRPAFREARSHLVPIVTWGILVGVALGVSTMIFPRWGKWWFAVAVSIVVGVMMFAYVALPSRLIGVKVTHSRRDQLSATAIGGAIGAVVCTPPYVLGRIGILMLGIRYLLVPGIIFLALGVTLQAGATGAVKAIKMSAKLAVGRSPEDEPKEPKPA